MSQALPTSFAPAERCTFVEVHRQARQLWSEAPLLRQILDAVPSIVTVLNRERQIVFANRSLCAFLGKDEEALIGLRPGEALDCVHAFETDCGCGTTEFCTTCGAVRAILSSQQGCADVQECRIIRRRSPDALDLRAWATPQQINGEQVTVFSVTDISHEKRRIALERIFFHDVLGVIAALRMRAEDLRESAPDSLATQVNTICRLVGRLVDEIKGQKELAAAESNDLPVHPAPVDALRMVRDVAQIFGEHELGRQRPIRIETDLEEVKLFTDEALLRRVVENMVRNALEACDASEVVTLGCAVCGGRVEIWVHNPGAMPRPVQLQVFQRSFSTKGPGRGLGTYGMKLLTERYLDGRITFLTTEKGTTFKASYPLKLGE